MLHRISRLLPFTLLALALAVLVWLGSGAKMPVMFPAGPVALAERQLMLDVVSLSAIVVLPVFALLFGFAWRYRDRGQPVDPADWRYAHSAEIIWWLVPAAIICALGTLAWQSAHTLDPYRPLDPGQQPLTVDVVALDWKWLFIYPEQGIATVNELDIPIGKPVSFHLTADAPMNSFWIPALGGQIMVMPGMVTQLQLLASTTGMYEGYSGNLSGEGFAGMHFDVHALSPDSFASWAAALRQAPENPLTQDAYDALAKPSSAVPPAAYTAINPMLFEWVTMRYMMPSVPYPALPPGSAAAASATPAVMMATDSPSMPGMMDGMRM